MFGKPVAGVACGLLATLMLLFVVAVPAHATWAVIVLAVFILIEVVALVWLGWDRRRA